MSHSVEHRSAESDSDGGKDAIAGVYVHVPFCERVCPYCDFAVVRAPSLSREDEERYVAALLRELEMRIGNFAGRQLASLYLGGGTPSLLTPRSVERIVDAVRVAFRTASGAPLEITLEVNPSSVERTRLPHFLEAGVNRLSLGVQSFDDRVLKRLGRAHRALEARRTLGACREAGFENLSLDLVYAAPDQTLAALEGDLAEALSFSPEHVSAYELTIEPGTPFETAQRRGQLRLPDEDLALAMAEVVESRLADKGLNRYEISSYAHPSREAVHNRLYWRRQPTLGLGVGAASLEPPREGAPWGARVQNERDLGRFLARVEAVPFPASSAREVFDAATARGEAVFLALREMRGLRAAVFAMEFGGRPRSFYAREIDELLSLDLVTENDAGDLALTRSGLLLSNSVFERFVG